MTHIRLKALAIAGALVSLSPILARGQYATSVAAYSPGSGVISAYANPNQALGAPTTFIGYQNADPFNPPYASGNLTGIGAGGYLTLNFTTPIQRDAAHPFGLDFIVFGHAGFMITNGNYSGGGITDGSFYTGGTSATRLSVSADGEHYFTLNPAIAPSVDGLYPTDSAGDFQLPVNPALTASDFAGKDLDGIRALYAGSGGGTGFSLAWAQTQDGQPVSLPEINYVRIDVLSGEAFIDAVSAAPEPGVGPLGILAGVLCWCVRRRNG